MNESLPGGFWGAVPMKVMLVTATLMLSITTASAQRSLSTEDAQQLLVNVPLVLKVKADGGCPDVRLLWTTERTAFFQVRDSCSRGPSGLINNFSVHLTTGEIWSGVDRERDGSNVVDSLQLRELRRKLLSGNAPRVLRPEQSRSNVEQQIRAEAEAFAERIRKAVAEGSARQLEALLFATVVVGLDLEVPAEAVQKDFRDKGEIYCRIFDTSCARHHYKLRESKGLRGTHGCRLSDCFLSVRDILSKENSDVRTVIRFFSEGFGRDLTSAQIIFIPDDDSIDYGWREMPPTVAVIKTDGGWRVAMLFPPNY